MRNTTITPSGKPKLPYDRKTEAIKWLNSHLKSGGKIKIPSISQEKLQSLLFGKDPKRVLVGIDLGDKSGSTTFKVGYVKDHAVTLMDFSKALLEMKKGKKVSRISWQSTERFLSIPLYLGPKVMPDTKVCGKHNKKSAQQNNGLLTVDPYLSLHTPANHVQMGYLPTSEDLFAEDYYIVP